MLQALHYFGLLRNCAEIVSRLSNRLRLTMHALIAGDMNCALANAAQAKATQEREIHAILSFKTSKRQWRADPRARRNGYSP